jgi:acyl-CoA synthetase (AMP-forming)/AMP-acid ligase II
MNIVGHFVAAATAHPQNIALVYKSEELTYAQLLHKVQKCSAALQQAGINAGDNVMLMIPFSIDLYVKILALFYMGARVVLVDAIKDRDKVVNAYNKAECKAIITVPLIHCLRYFLFSKVLCGEFLRLKSSQTGQTNPVITDEKETALITFTTGSTGDPKAANRTHQFLTTQLDTLIEEMQLNSNDIHISSLPVVLMCNLAVGASSIIPPKDSFLQRRYWKNIKPNFQPNVVSSSPFYVLYFNENLDTSKYQKVFVGGASILPHFAQGLAQTIGADKILFVYGSTEAEPMASIAATDYLKQLNDEERGIAVGKAHENLKLIIGRVENDKIDVLKEGEIGEILVAGNHVLADYYKDEQAFVKNKVEYEEKIWHRTGDAGKLSAGQLYFYGRLKYTWMENGLLQSPTCFEKWLSIELGEREATLLRINNKNCIFYTGDKNNHLIPALANSIYQIDEWVQVKKLPRDNRHQSRIDYEQLIQLSTNL